MKNSEKIAKAVNVVKSKSNYKKFPSGGKVPTTLTVKGEKLTGEEAKELYYSRKFNSLTGKIKKKGTEEANAEALKILKSWGAKSGEEQAKAAYDTLMKINDLYKGTGGGRSRKLAESEKADLSFLA